MSVTATALALSSFAFSASASASGTGTRAFQDYSIWAEAVVEQFSDEWGNVLHVLGSFILTMIKIILSFIEANAIYFIIIGFFLLLWWVLAIRSHFSSAKSATMAWGWGWGSSNGYKTGR